MSEQEIKKDPSARRLQQVKRNGDEWSLKWMEGSDVCTFTSKEAPPPELGEELEKITPFAIIQCGFIEKKYHGDTRSYGIVFDWKGESNRRNGEVLMQIDLGENGFSKLRSPKKLADSQMEEAIVGRWSVEAVKQFDRIVHHCFSYIDGARLEPKLPLVQKEETGKAKKDAKEPIAA